MNHPLGSSNNYLFVDGSSLLADIPKARAHLEASVPSITGAHKLDFSAFVQAAITDFQEFHGRQYRRFTTYFVNGETRVKSLIKMRDPSEPGAMRDMSIVYCGARIRESARAEDWLRENSDKVPKYVQDRLHRTEKAVDTQICCDALQLAVLGRLDRLFLYTNDYDYVPLCRVLRQLGININLFRLLRENVNNELVKECDGFSTLEASGGLFHLFQT